MGNDKFSYDGARLVTGKTVPLRLNMLPGSPVAHIEHLGDTNAGYLNEVAAEATLAAAGGRKRTAEERKEVRVKRRGIIARHAVRKIDAKKRDGSAATEADIPDWCDAIPDDVVDTVYLFALDADNFREHSFAKAADVAEG